MPPAFNHPRVIQNPGEIASRIIPCHDHPDRLLELLRHDSTTALAAHTLQPNSNRQSNGSNNAIPKVPNGILSQYIGVSRNVYCEAVCIHMRPSMCIPRICQSLTCYLPSIEIGLSAIPLSRPVRRGVPCRDLSPPSLYCPFRSACSTLVKMRTFLHLR